MKHYKELLQHILDNGVDKNDRTGTGTKSVFGVQLRFNLAEGFPLLTTKKMYDEKKGGLLRIIILELLWFLSGDTNIKPLLDNEVNIWNLDCYRGYKEWMLENETYAYHQGCYLNYEAFLEEIKTNECFASIFGCLGPIYGAQWRRWGNYYKDIDQIANVIEELRKNPDSRRHLVSAWNVGELDQMTLPPCHYAFQFYVANNKLSCMFQMRSTDVFLGLPFNIASYALLTMMVADLLGYELGELIYTGGDVHIYHNHIDQVKLQLTREPKPLPTMTIVNKRKSIDDYKYEDFELEGYTSHPFIKGEMST